MLSDYKKKKKGSFRDKFLFHLGGILVIVVAIVLVIANINMYEKSKAFTGQVSDLQQQIQNLKNQNQSLQQGLSQENNDQYIEKVAREELDLQKQGETVVSFVMPQNQSSKNNAQQTNSWQAWLGGAWSWIKSLF